MRKQLLLLISAGTLLLSGCVTWQQGGQRYTAGSGAYSFTPPAGWMFIEQPAGEIRATRDGLILQQVTVQSRALKDPLPGSKRVLTAGLTPFELAEALADDLRADHSLLGIEILKNEPAKFGQRDGFKLVVHYQTKDRLRITQSIYGCIDQSKLYLIRFAAPSRHYYERDLASFEAAVQSFQFSKS
ncbi:MAG: hypothetical protein HYV95_06340 [Opitutae bacterium]|nr:hypothetical protein [Opitutae bacterium]